MNERDYVRLHENTVCMIIACPVQGYLIQLAREDWSNAMLFVIFLSIEINIYFL